MRNEQLGMQCQQVKETWLLHLLFKDLTQRRKGASYLWYADGAELPDCAFPTAPPRTLREVLLNLNP
jgi:hypothetical protein